MWQSRRAFFSPVGESSEAEERAADTGLRQLWISLVRLGMARGLTLQDAEDLAQDRRLLGDLCRVAAGDVRGGEKLPLGPPPLSDDTAPTVARAPFELEYLPWVE